MMRKHPLLVSSKPLEQHKTTAATTRTQAVFHPVGLARTHTHTRIQVRADLHSARSTALLSSLINADTHKNTFQLCRGTQTQDPARFPEMWAAYSETLRSTRNFRRRNLCTETGLKFRLNFQSNPWKFSIFCSTLSGNMSDGIETSPLWLPVCLSCATMRFKHVTRSRS